MDKKHLLVGIGGGLVSGLILGIGWLGGVAAPRVAAQAAPAEPPRFQITTWSYPGATTANGSAYSPSHGAFLLESRTGKLWESRDGGQLKPLGQAQ